MAKFTSLFGYKLGLGSIEELRAPGGLATDVTAESTGTNLKAGGVSTIASTSGAKSYTLDAPVPGVRKTIWCTAGSTANTSKVTSSASFDGTNFAATFNAAGDALELVGLSATRWGIIANLGSVSLTTA